MWVSVSQSSLARHLEDLRQALRLTDRLGVRLPSCQPTLRCSWTRMSDSCTERAECDSTHNRWTGRHDRQDDRSQAPEGLVDGGSFNGRTGAFEALDRGSSP